MSYRSSSQQTLLAVLEALIEGDEPFAGRELQLLIGERDRTAVYRALKNLELAGWAEQAPGGVWRCTPRIGRLSERVRRALQDLGTAWLLAPRS